MKIKIIFYASILLGIFGIFLFIENDFRQCGAGILADSELAGGMRAKWFNGAFTLEDEEGMGILYPGAEIRDGKNFNEVVWVKKYAIEDNKVYAAFESTGGIKFLAIGFEGVQISTKIVSAQEIKSLTIRWIQVDAKDCYFGLFGLVRFALSVIFICVFFMIVFLIKRSRALSNSS